MKQKRGYFLWHRTMLSASKAKIYPIKANECEVIDMRALIAIPIVIAIILLTLFLTASIAAFNGIISIKEAMAITRIRLFI